MSEVFESFSLTPCWRPRDAPRRPELVVGRGPSAARLARRLLADAGRAQGLKVAVFTPGPVLFVLDRADDQEPATLDDSPAGPPLEGLWCPGCEYLGRADGEPELWLPTSLGLCLDASDEIPLDEALVVQALLRQEGRAAFPAALLPSEDDDFEFFSLGSAAAFDPVDLAACFGLSRSDLSRPGQAGPPAAEEPESLPGRAP